MKKILLLSLLLSLGLIGFSQNRRATVSKSLQNQVSQKVQLGNDVSTGNAVNSPATVKLNHKSVKSINEDEIMQTKYDLQSNGSTPYGRFFIYDDGTRGAVTTMGFNTSNWPDRGTGYNYFDGTSWGSEPQARIETVRTGWPQYSALGPNGEYVIAHAATGGLITSTRTTKGTGAWTAGTLAAPTTPSGLSLSWPRMITSGTDHNTIHVIAITNPSTILYQGLNGALAYSRSTDGGATWDKHNVVLDGMGSADYWGYGADVYSWIAPQGDNLAFIVSSPMQDLFVMKSADGGDTWEKTIIWEHPYPHWNGTTAVDTIYCPDGSAHGVFDNNGVLHVAFGIFRVLNGTTAGSYSFFRGYDGIGYWNENLPTWTGGTVAEQCNCLNPETLDQQGSLVGYCQDLNGNGELDIVGVSNYQVGMSSHPQLICDANNNLYLLYSGVIEGLDNGSLNYRHIWGRGSSDGGQTWGDFIDFTGDLLHQYDECVFPVIASKIVDNNYIHLIYQADTDPGMFLSSSGDQPSASDNFIRDLEISLDEFGLIPNPGHTVDGTVTYPKTPPVPLSDIEISLKDNGGNILQTYTTDGTGHFNFFDIPDGDYTLAPSTTKAWGGVTAGDVLLYKKHIAGINTLTGIFLASGDVNASGSLTAGDVLLIKKRIAGIISSFSVGDWIFNNVPVTVSGGDVTQDFNGLIYGDANASYNPVVKGNNNAPKSTTTGEALTIGNVSTTDLGAITVPVHASAINNLGSFQFSISYDASKLAYVSDANWYMGITGVTINSANPGKVSFVWAADAPVTLSDNTLVELNFNVISEGASAIAWIDNPTSREFGNYDGNVFVPAYTDGNVDVVTGINDLSNTAMVVSPNPNNGNFTLDLSSVKSQVSNVKIMNMVGGVVYQQKVAQNATFNQNINLNNLSDGVYTILIQTNNGDIVKKMVIKK